MARHNNPRIATDGLVLCLDAANIKSFDPRENIYPHGETLQSLSNSRVTRQSFTTSGPFGRGYQEFTVTETATENIYNFDSGNTISLVAGQITTFSVYFRNISLTGDIFLRCWTGAGRAWTTQRQVVYDLVNETSTVSTGTILRHSISNEGGGWYRLSMSVQADQAGFSAISINVGGVVGQQYQATAVQVSNGLALTEYLITTGTTIQRSTSVTNLTNNSNVGTLVGGMNFLSDNSGEFIFDGTSGYILFDQSYTISNQGGTFSCWMYIDDFVVVSGHTPGRITFGNTGFNFSNMLAVYNGGYGFESNTNSNPDELSGDVTPENSVPSVVAGTWINMTVVMSNTQHTFYTNGINRRTDSMPDNFVTNNFGEQANDTSYPDFFKGKVSNIQIYNRALTELEIQQNFNALRGRFGI